MYLILQIEIQLVNNESIKIQHKTVTGATSIS